MSNSKLFCMFGIHQRNWEQYQTVRLIDSYQTKGVVGYRYYYKGTCSVCGHTKHKMKEV